MLENNNIIVEYRESRTLEQNYFSKTPYSLYLIS